MAISPVSFVSTLVVVQLLIAMACAQPRIPSAFSAQITSYSEGYQMSAEVYVNYDAEMVLTVTNFGILSNGAGQAYTYMTGSGESTYLYRYLEAFDSCTKMYTGGMAFPQLNMLQNGTYLRSHSFMGRQVDVWQYTITTAYTTVTIEFAFLTSDYETPVYLIYGTNYGFSRPVIINSFTNSPPSSSWFTIPSGCAMDKNKSGKLGKDKVKDFFKTRDVFGIKLV